VNCDLKYRRASSQVPQLEFTQLPEKEAVQEMNNELVAKELVAIARELQAAIFPSQNALREYLREHPDSDRSKHKVNYKEWKRKYRSSESITAAWRQGQGEIKFVIGDLVKIGTRRNVYKVTGVRLEYAVYDDNRKFIDTYPHQYVNQWFEPVGWRSVNMRQAGATKDGYGAIGDKVRVIGGRSHSAVLGQEYTIGLIHENYDLEGVNTSKSLHNMEYQYLEPAEAEPRDQEGRTAVEALLEEYGVVGSLVVENMGRMDTLGKIMAISDNGRIKVGLFPVGEWHGQEDYTPDTSRVEEVKVYSPRLMSGHWYWSGGRGGLRKYNGEKTLQHLLD